MSWDEINPLKNNFPDSTILTSISAKFRVYTLKILAQVTKVPQFWSRVLYEFKKKINRRSQEIYHFRLILP